MTFMNGTDRAGRGWDSLQFRAIFAICLPACFCSAVSGRLNPNFWRKEAGRRSIFAEACEAAGTTARLALAG